MATTRSPFVFKCEVGTINMFLPEDLNLHTGFTGTAVLVYILESSHEGL